MIGLWNRRDSESQENNSEETQSGFHPIRYRLNRFFHRCFSRKPAYRIRPNGIEVRYFNFDNPETLPFDKDTYNETQIFIGKWANPWYVDFEAIEEQYDNFTEDTITTVDDVFEKQHIYPSQRWKTLANQNVLSEMFVGRSVRQERVIRLLYAVLGAIAILFILTVFGG